jgi:hypothetical protein
MARLSSWLLIAGLLLGTAPVAAEDEEKFSLDEPDPAGGEATAPTPKETAAAGEQQLLGDEQALQEERAPQEKYRDSSDPYEDPSKRYYFLGAGWRFASLPSGLLKAYTVQTDANLFTPASFFAEAGFRRKGFQIGVNVGYLNWEFADAFRFGDDPIEDMEWLDTKFKFLVTTTTITWSTAFTDWFQLEYGLEAGLAFVMGRMIRNEAVKQPNGKWAKCETWADQQGFTNDNQAYPNPNPSPTEELYCDLPLSENDDDQPPATNAADEIGAHYGVRAKRGAFNEGVPYVLPVLGPRLSLRFKPIAQLVLRVDVPLPSIPFGVMGGVSAQFGF